MVSVFGIRHHGPGSANSLLMALQELQPDRILVEGPPDADQIIDFVGNPALLPPVAILVFNPTNLKQAVYYPFTKFSPEWQALKFAVERELPVSFMDLPRALVFSMNQDHSQNFQKIIDFEKPEKVDPEKERIGKDPLAFLAKIAGYEDSERWWDLTFERSANSIEAFQLITTLMNELRQSVINPPLRELQREAYMRTLIRKEVKSGYKNIAVICGAWHAPVLSQWEKFSAATDRKLLKGLKKIKTRATWVPWTYHRIAKSSGYGAGVISPAWYELLFDRPDEVTVQWMLKAAQLLRTEDLSTSSAHIIASVRLANTLAAIRQISLPGITELKEAIKAVMCEGDERPIQLIEKRLIIGEKMGEVPEEIPVVPLQEDINQCIKSARLGKEKKAIGTLEKILDLRKPGNLLASLLLHRLNILGISWGELIENSQQTKGSFKEVWSLEWRPDFAIAIIEAGMWGNTLYEAATNYMLKKINEQADLASLCRLIEFALKADLKEAVSPLTRSLVDKSAMTRDIFNLMLSFPPLVNIIRYGSSRKMNVNSIEIVVDHIVPRICIGLPMACININEEVGDDIFAKILGVNRALQILNNSNYLQNWYETLEKIMSQTTQGNIAGLCTRLLFDKHCILAHNAANQMYLSLSKGKEMLFAARWLEGFLYGSGLLLIYNQQLWTILDQWLDDLEEAHFFEILPVLRRAFSKFSHPERSKIFELAKRGRQHKEKPDTPELVLQNYDEERTGKVMPVLKLLLGLDE